MLWEDGCRALNLNEVEFVTDLHQQIDFEAIARAKVIQGRQLAEMEKSFPEVGDNKGLEQMGKMRTVQ